MNKEKIISIARNIFPDITPVSDNSDLYRAELKISGKSAGIYYMDLSNEVEAETFNEYQEKILADEYYNQPGSLQWNLYLLLLQDTINPETKEKIERNDKYARKYVFTEEQFEDFFQLEKSDAVVSSNIVLQWKETLKKVDLQEVYSKANYTEAVERFITNQTKKITSTESASDISDSIKLSFINQITLKNTFREHPKEPRVFRFGKVNLIKGINGVGKTSLLEAIELIACGKTFRNSDKKEPDNCIDALVNNSRQIEHCTPSDNTKYRQRDAYWYSNNYVKDNFSYTSFNRFNFFNTDAANDFASSNTEDEVRQALSNIILGTEFNYITERINGFFDRIKPVYNELNRGIRDAQQVIKNADQIISKFGKSETLTELINIVNGNVNALHFKNKDLNAEKGTGETEALINQAKVLTEKILGVQSPSFGNQREFKHAKSELTRKETFFKTFKKDLEEITKEISTQEQAINAVTEKYNLLVSVQKYFTDPRLFEIKGFNNRSAEVEESIRKVQALNRSLGTINIQALSSDENINTAINRTRNELTTAKSLQYNSEADMKNLLAQFSNTEKVVNEIKLLGKEYLTVSPDADACPLCQTPYDRSELQQRIEEVLQSNSKENQARLDTLHQQQQFANDLVDKLTGILNELTAIKTAYDNAFNTDSVDKTLLEIVQEIKRLKDQESLLMQKKQELSAFRQTAESFNVTEEEFSFLGAKISTDIGPEFILAMENQQLFAGRILKLSIEINQLKEDLDKIQERKFKLSADFKKDIGLEEDKSYTLNEFATTLDSENKQMATANGFFNQLIQVIELSEDDSISELDLQLSVLQKNLASLKTEQQNQYELNRAEKDKQQSQTFLDANIKKFERIKAGFDTLQSLKQSDGTQQLNTFFDSNLKEVVDIFKTIHTPREFKSLVFQDKQLFLIKENDKKHKINEISTGQRAALALSIFISLNRQLKNGPNIIIFDDPVSHIDDLNALSFLDFLRFFILKEDRQIFFATANTRLASLFEKKFEFLENDFQKWELKR